jgi:hypothetical protein
MLTRSIMVRKPGTIPPGGRVAESEENLFGALD